MTLDPKGLCLIFHSESKNIGTMKNYVFTILALILLALTPFSCREKQPNDRDMDGVRDTEERQDNTDQYRDRYENDQTVDTMSRDTTMRDTTRRN